LGRRASSRLRPRRGPPGVGRPSRRPARLLAAGLALALAGCTGGGSGGADGPSSGPGGGGGAPRGRVGGTLAIALLDPGPLDPARADGLEDEVVLGNLFDGLTTIDPTGAVRPAVAASWSSDPTLRRWEFRLRPEARWSDATPVTAADFVAAWLRLARVGVESASGAVRPSGADAAGAGPYPARTLLADVSGYGAFAAGRARAISGLEAPDPATLVVRLDRPSADFPALVAALPLSPLPAAALRRNPAAYLVRPTGNGPFRLAAPAQPGRPLTLERNPAYWGTPALLDRVSIHPVPDEQTAWLELQHGRVAFAPVPPDQLAAARTVHGPSADHRTRPGLLQGPTLTTWQLTFDSTSKLARDPRWRQAVSLAVDRRRLAAAIGGSAATSLVPPATPGWGAGGGAAGTGGGGIAPACAACAHDPARARALIAKVEGARAPVPLAVPAGADAQAIADRLSADLAAAGIKTTPTPSPAAGSPLTLVRRTAPYPRPAAFLTAPFATRGPANPTGYTSRPVDRLLDQARATADDPARTALLRQAEAAILADLPATPLVTDRHAAVLAPGPQGFDLTPWSTLDLATVSLPA
jgi:oligopeptide transport system substrate-binding protein